MSRAILPLPDEALLRPQGVEDSEIAGNGDAGVVLMGGDRNTLTPSRHFVRNCTVRSRDAARAHVGAAGHAAARVVDGAAALQDGYYIIVQPYL